jgi:flagellar L-ring protein precursor FlgH
MKKITFAVILLCSAAARADDPPKAKTSKPKQPTALDKYIEQASLPEAPNGPTVDAGSLWTANARFSDLAADQRSRRVDDIVTIVVSESASAVSTGQTKTSRQATAQSSISALGGLTPAAGALSNLLNSSTQTALDGEGTTSRTTTLTTTLSARVTHVLRNGNLVVEGTRNIGINSENQLITVRGVIRPIDLDTTNSVLSARLAQMEIQVNGKGVVSDAIRRPNILYRILLGLLPF